MILIKWTDDYCLNIKAIDDQHKKLVDMINMFYNEMSKKSNKELISDLISKMKAYTEFHFKTEEELFSKLPYQNSNEHKDKHQDFIDKVTDLENRFIKGKLILSIEITNFLKEWITDHIMVSDKEYAKIYNDKEQLNPVRNSF